MDQNACDTKYLSFFFYESSATEVETRSINDFLDDKRYINCVSK